jgi:hypothetical protein
MAVLYFFLFIAAAALYLGYVACAVPIAAAVAFAAYGVGLPVAYFIGLWRVLVSRPAWLPAPKRLPKIPAGADPAVRQYFYGPALTDADHAVRVAYTTCRDLWRRGARQVSSSFRGEGVVLSAPAGVGGALGMAAGLVFGAAAAIGCAIVHLLAVGISAAVVRAAGTTLRAVDSAVLRVKNIRMVCPNTNCYEQVRYPSYECPGRACSRRHRDVRPGPFGILRRRCECGTRMKTLLLFGSAQMDAFCPHCGKSLEHRPGKTAEIVLPFFGAIGAGKTRLLFSMVTQLLLWSQEAAPGRERFVAELADTATTGKLADADRWLIQDSATGKTPAELPRAYLIRMTAGHDRRLLHMFDAAGEFFHTPGRTQELRYLNKAQTFILVIDPLSVEAFWDRLLPEQQAELKAVRSAAPSPELAYQQAHQEIEAMGVRLKKARLAVAFSRADLISTPGDDVAGWATDELGLGNLVRSVRLNFREACFFHTAAVMADGVMDTSIPALLRWVLARNGINASGDLS